MIKVEGPIAALLIAAALQLILEVRLHVVEYAKDARFRWSLRRTHGSLPDGWRSSQGARLASALVKQRAGR